MRMPDFLVRFSSGIAIVAAAVLVSSASAQTCPDNTLWYGCYDLVGNTTNATSFKYEGGSWVLGEYCRTGCYNLATGDFSANGYGDPSGPGCTSAMIVSDDFLLEGLSPGADVPFFAELHVHGSLEGDAHYYGELQDESGTKAEGSSVTEGSEFVIRLPVSHAPGVPFRLSVSFGATGNFPDGVAHGLAHLRFSGLPAEATITSCHNYDVPVPAQAKSWGSLKSIYRD